MRQGLFRKLALLMSVLYIQYCKWCEVAFAAFSMGIAEHCQEMKGASIIFDPSHRCAYWTHDSCMRADTRKQQLFSIGDWLEDQDLTPLMAGPDAVQIRPVQVSRVPCCLVNHMHVRLGDLHQYIGAEDKYILVQKITAMQQSHLICSPTIVSYFSLASSFLHTANVSHSIVVCLTPRVHHLHPIRFYFQVICTFMSSYVYVCMYAYV